MRWTTSLITRFLLLISLCCCEAFAQGPVAVGVVVSHSGPHAELAEGYGKALLLWQEEVNAAGGLLGRGVALRMLDDGSTASRAGALYEELIKKERVELLIGPYGSAATLLAAAAAERAQRVIVNGAGPARAVHRRAPRYVFQTCIPNAAYGPALLDVLRAEGITRLFILARDEPASREMAESLRAAAAAEVQFYGADVKDFKDYVAKARIANAEAWIAFGGAADAADMVKTFKRLDYAPRLFFARGAADAKFITLVGQDAEFTLLSIEYDARFATPGNDKFVKAYAARWGTAPGPSAAEGYAAATVLAAAVRRAGSFDQEKLRAALAALETDTVLGRHKVNPAGEQVAARPTLAQVRGGKHGVLTRGERPVPYPQWSERVVMK